MKAVGLNKYLPIADENSLFDFEEEAPSATGRDLLVEVKAISVNPVDTKVRSPKEAIEEKPRILGWDAAGTVVSVGKLVTKFQPGDDVFYAGDITRAGTNSEYQLVDERIVGRKPDSLDFANAAALPLTSITAWEALFDRLNISEQGDDKGKSILIIGGAGGVGSIAIQLAKKLAMLTVIASASRSDTIDWCKQLGADITVNHRNNLAEELQNTNYKQVDYILCLNDTDGHWGAMAEAIKPQGTICTIVENSQPLDMSQLKLKSVGLVWELMFTRSMYQTQDMEQQHFLLNKISNLIDSKEIISTCNDIITPINAANLRAIHARIESGNVIGKIVLANWN